MPDTGTYGGEGTSGLVGKIFQSISKYFIPQYVSSILPIAIQDQDQKKENVPLQFSTWGTPI